MSKIKACFFDLDGVICDTGKLHYLARKRLANELGIDISPEQNDSFKGLNRMEVLERMLEWGRRNFTYAEKEQLVKRKHQWYLENTSLLTPDDVMPGVTALLSELATKKIKIVLVTSSRQASLVLELLQLTHYFDNIIDGNMVINLKPNPEVYLKAAEAVSCKPSECIVFEDAPDGIIAGIGAGCYTVGVGNMKSLKKANLVISSFEDMPFEDIISCLN